ncbi:MAG: S8/S53 family peptidase [Actinomycetota bacterium]|nr:S8/S53 family peptidase [Actinomycetota bacterium]
MKKYLSLLIIVVLSLVAASCSSSEEALPIRQASLDEAGGVINSSFPFLVEDYLVEDVLSVIPDDVTWWTSPEELDAIYKIIDQIGAAPVVMQLPVGWEPEGVIGGGRELKNRDAVERQREEIAAAAKVVQTRIERQQSYSRLSFLMSEYVAAYNAVNGLKDYQPAEDNRDDRDLREQAIPREFKESPVSSRQYWAPIGSNPFVRAVVDREILSDLISNKLIVSVGLDIPLYEQLDDSTDSDLVGSAELNEFLGIDGSGTTVAIVDSGVWSGHPALGGKVVLEACVDVVFRTCPTSGGGFSNFSTGPGTAQPNSNDHGTHVAGTAAGVSVPVGSIPSEPGVTIPDEEWAAGVAPGANIAAIRISRGGIASLRSDTTRLSLSTNFWLAAFQVALWVADGENIVAVNNSWGSAAPVPAGGATVACDSRNTSDLLAKAAIDGLISMNVAPIFASGNDSFLNGAAFPACVSTAISVGNTTKNDNVRTSSNFQTTLVDIQAPGTNIVAAGRNGTGGSLWMEDKTGTSMAAPHVAGAWALIREVYPAMNVASVLNLLQSTGVPVADTRPGGTGLSIPRIDLQAALPNFTKGLPAKTFEYETFIGNRKTYSEGTGLASLDRDTWEGTISLGGSSVDPTSATAAYLYFSTRGSVVDNVTVNGRLYNEDDIQQVGYSKAPCRDITPMRSYRISFPPKTLNKGDNAIRVYLDDPSGTADGASILMIGNVKPSLFTTGGVVLVHGASVLDDVDMAMAALPLGYPFSKAGSYLHVGMADGQSAYEPGILFRTSTDAVIGKFVTPSSAFKGTDGPNWDDITFNLKKSGLSGYSGHATITHEGAPLKALSYDCLGWVYAALNVKQVRDLKMERAPMTPGITKRLDTVIDLPDQLEGIEPDWKKGIPIEVPGFILEPIKFPPQPLPRP